MYRRVEDGKSNYCNSNLVQFEWVMARAADPSESSRLLVSTASEDSSPVQQKSVCISCPPLKHLCLPSKAAILILLWTAIVGAIYFNFVGLSAALVLSNQTPNAVLSEYEPLPYAILAIVTIFYPLSGFIADVCCGRLKTVVVSLIFLVSCWIVVLVALSVVASISKPEISDLKHNQGLVVVVILALISLFTFITGLAGYQANIIQLGLDQLFEAPSQYLGLFIHYASWAFRLGSLHTLVNILLIMCYKSKASNIAQILMQMLVLFLLTILLLISYWKRRWFYSEPGHQNPYKAVYGVFKFAKNHKYPLRRSAFTHCDNYIPSRLDFAKERFGGPFTTEQVENVKTFLRILLILFAVGPVFVLEVPASYFIAPLFSMHFHQFHMEREYCNGKFMLDVMMEILGWVLAPILLLFPLYIWIIFSLLRKRVLKLFTRLGVGICICLLGVVSLLVTDIVGHTENTGISSSNNYTQCVFQVSLSHEKVTYHSLNMHWAVLVPPGLLLGIGPLLVTVTTLEFISAQSPQSMKGLLVGVFFAIRGLFQFLNSIVIIPLSLKQPWADREMIDHPPVTNCGFVYLALTSVTGLIGLVLFLLAAKRYKYRTRDEGIFRQHDVEEIYDRYIDQAEANMQ